MILFFDTETSGIADFKASHTESWQPNLVQLAAILCDHDGRTVQQFEFLVCPDGWEIEESAFQVHGFETSFCIDHGMPMKTVLNAFNMLCRRAKTVVAYNIEFDYKVMQTAFHRAEIAHHFDSVERVCAMKPMTDVCRIPAGRGRYKWPSLSEAHRHVFGTDFVGAHGALADTKAMRRVFLEMRCRNGGRWPT